MKTIPALFFAGFSCALLSGCYVDRKPTMTLEEKMWADTSKSERVESNPLTAQDYTNFLGKFSHVDVFSLKPKLGAPVRVCFFIKLHDVAKGERSVEFVESLVISGSDRQGGLVTVVGSDGLHAFPYDTGPGRSKPVKKGAALLLYADLMSGEAIRIHSGDNEPGTGLLLPAGAISRFVVRNEGFLKKDKDASQVIATSGLVFEIECVVMPVDEKIDIEKEAERLRTFIDEEWAKRTAK